MIYSYDLEQQLIAALIKYPEKYAEIASFVSEKDFFSESNNVNKIIFLCLKQLLEIGQKCDDVD
jgi:replicative DNA helicase